MNLQEALLVIATLFLTDWSCLKILGWWGEMRVFRGNLRGVIDK